MQMYAVGMNVTDLQFAVLTALAAGRQHGYALVKEAESQLGKVVPIATGYACFEAMLSRGWMDLDGEEVVQGRTRRYYALSRAGADVLRERADQLAARARVAHERLGVSTGRPVTT